MPKPVVVYKVDRLSRSLADFVRLVKLFDQRGVSFVSVTQQFNTSTSMGRLTLNVLLSFAQFEREVTSERIRDKIAASKKKGMWMGGLVPLGYDRVDKQLVVNAAEAEQVHHIYTRYLALGCVRRLKAELDQDGIVSKVRRAGSKHAGGQPFARGALYSILKNPVYIGKVSHKGKLHPGKHQSLLDATLWRQVQQRMAENRQRKRTRVNARTPSLLAGYLFDDRGNPMSPSQSHRGSRRYRYYVSQAVMQYREQEAGSVARVPADSLEALVSDQWLAFLRDGTRVLDAMGAGTWSASQQQALLASASGLAETWENASMSQRIEQLRRLKPRITISRSALHIELPAETLVKTLGAVRTKPSVTHGSSRIEWTVPVALKRSGIETKLVIPSGPPPQAHISSTRALRDAVEKALTWNQALLSDPSASTYTLAKTEGVTQRFIAQRLQLAWLAPDILQRILAGTIPDTLTLEKIKNRRIPLDWAEQRVFFQLN